jgi:dTDP-glucose 4,6-dehydratase
MNIIVTGGLGFIGSNFIINQIKKTDNHILNIDKITYAGNIKNLSEIERNKNYSFLKSDICSKNIIEKAFDEFRPDYIVNFAAESHVDRSIENPMEFVETNVVGTVNLLQCSTDYYRKVNNKKFRFLHVSTDEVFGSLESTGYFTEHTSYDPSSPYSASKAASDHFVRSWNRTFNLPTIITNCSNNYGPRQFPEKLIPLMVINCLNEKSLPIYGSGDNIRDWLYVTDHCDAIYEVLTKGKIGETYNIGGDNEISNLDIVRTICSIMDELKPRKNNKSFSELIKYVEDRPGHDFRYAIDASKIKEKLKWSPKENFHSGIRKTINWYLDNHKWIYDLEKKYNQTRIGLK